jgi:transcriptional regulator with XRE-family HTH domain
MITKLGIQLRKIRLDCGEILKNMSDKLDMSSAYLSSIENGHRVTPKDMLYKILDKYNLDTDTVENLTKAFEVSKYETALNIKNKETEEQVLAYSFAREFDTFAESEDEKIQKIIDNNDISA